jgi:predicted ArsR family transcriptional regulator
LTNINCPYRHVTREHPEICVMDTVLLSRLLEVEPARLSSFRTGDPACSCLLVPAE